MEMPAIVNKCNDLISRLQSGGSSLELLQLCFDCSRFLKSEWATTAYRLVIVTVRR